MRTISACVLTAVVLGLAVPAAAQQGIQRTGDSYDREIGGKYVVMSEEGGYTGTPGFLIEGGYRVWRLSRWHVQAIGEFMMVHFDDGDATYKQGAGGVRFGTLVSPNLRAFGQFQLGAQNDGFANAATAFVVMPGGGVNVALTRRLDLQVMFDVPIAQYGDEAFTQVRLAVGVALPLGGN